MILMTGHYSDEFSDFLPRHFHSLVTDFCYNDIDAFTQENNLDGVRVICNQDQQKLGVLLKAEIEREAKIRPVIVFGKTIDQQFIDSVVLPIGVHKTVVTADEHVKMARKFFLEQYKGVIFMSDQFIVGVDVKCGKDAAVLVFVAEGQQKPDREKLMQMLGRGQRSRGVYSGTFFITEHQGMEAVVEKIMKTDTTFDFLDGAENLRVVQKMKAPCQKGVKGRALPSWIAFVNAVGKHWINTRNDFVGIVPITARATVNCIYDELQDYKLQVKDDSKENEER